LLHSGLWPRPDRYDATDEGISPSPDVALGPHVLVLGNNLGVEVELAVAKKVAMLAFAAKTPGDGLLHGPRPVGHRRVQLPSDEGEVTQKLDAPVAAQRRDRVPRDIGTPVLLPALRHDMLYGEVVRARLALPQRTAQRVLNRLEPIRSRGRDRFL